MIHYFNVLKALLSIKKDWKQANVFVFILAEVQDEKPESV